MGWEGLGWSEMVSRWLLCLTDFHLPHPAALLYSALHLQRRMTIISYCLNQAVNKGIIHSKRKDSLYLLQLVLNTDKQGLLPSLTPKMPKLRGIAGSRS